MKEKTPVILEVNHLSKFYRDAKFFSKKHLVVDKVSFKVHQGEIFGITGHNSCGKSTLANMLVGAIKPDGGHIAYQGRELAFGDVKFRREHIRIAKTSLVEDFILPVDVNEFLSLPLEMAGIDRQFYPEIIHNVLGLINAPAILAAKYLGRLNAQEQSLVALAHSLILSPEIIIIDDIFATCDLSFKGVLINIILRLQELGHTVILITADLGIIKHVTNRVMILQDGVIEDLGNTYEVLNNTTSEFTARLIKSYFGRQLKASDWLFSLREL
ncbi:ATP-binding cassette domain-containing protein [Psittacicella hinzii]|uniref:ABC transporter domain-containing protein n=1 Tax=Psittacicella hinzii TaxID=2028575 RepID=A0A3A1YRM3_9GAMM|nr:ATP-binding cassette domain-containing protein [Psittacicella hinzii]RIY40146.1 hypothetical protein CKF58_01020 [Psittacicella hinzii]